MAMPADNALASDDTFSNGAIRVKQPVDGYRFSLDAPILADFVKEVASGRRILELGTGCGIIALLLACRFPEASIQAVEIQAVLADLARQNVVSNGYQNQIKVIHGDMRQWDTPKKTPQADLVLSNPPYRALGGGRLNPHSQKAAARHEIHITLTGLVAIAGLALGRGGRFLLVYLPERLPELLKTLGDYGFFVRFLRMVHSRIDQPARMCLVEAIKEQRERMQVLPPLFIYKSSQIYSEEMDRILGSVDIST